jgi:hypothetical protein
MPDIQDVMDVTIDDLSPEQQVQLKDAIDQFQQKCLMSFGKNRSGVPYLKSDMPRVLLTGERDSTAAQEKQEVLNAFRENIDNVMVKHHTAFLNMFKQMMVGVFGPGMERMLSRVSLRHLLRRLEEPELPNQLEVQTLNRHYKVNQSNCLRRAWEVNQSNHLLRAWAVSRFSRLYKAMEVAQFNNRTRIRQMDLHMEIWRSVHLDCRLTLLTR